MGDSHMQWTGTESWDKEHWGALGLSIPPQKTVHPTTGSIY